MPSGVGHEGTDGGRTGSRANGALDAGSALRPARDDEATAATAALQQLIQDASTVRLVRRALSDGRWAALDLSLKSSERIVQERVAAAAAELEQSERERERELFSQELSDMQPEHAPFGQSGPAMASPMVANRSNRSNRSGLRSSAVSSTSGALGAGRGSVLAAGRSESHTPADGNSGGAWGGMLSRCMPSASAEAPPSLVLRRFGQLAPEAAREFAAARTLADEVRFCTRYTLHGCVTYFHTCDTCYTSDTCYTWDTWHRAPCVCFCFWVWARRTPRDRETARPGANARAVIPGSCAGNFREIVGHTFLIGHCFGVARLTSHGRVSLKLKVCLSSRPHMVLRLFSRARWLGAHLGWVDGVGGVDGFFVRNRSTPWRRSSKLHSTSPRLPLSQAMRCEMRSNAPRRRYVPQSQLRADATVMRSTSRRL